MEWTLIENEKRLVEAAAYCNLGDWSLLPTVEICLHGPLRVSVRLLCFGLELWWMRKSESVPWEEAKKELGL